MNLRDLHYVTAVAEHLNFNRAAEACFVSQPSLSKQIQKLEDYLGVTIFERSNRKVSVTPIGEQIIIHARKALHEADAIRQAARDASDPLSGDLRLGIIPTVAPYLLARILGPLGEALPKINLMLREGTTRQIVLDAKRGDLDAVLLALPLQDDELEEVEIYREPFLLAVPRGHSLSRKKRVTADDVAGERLLLLEDGHCLRSQALNLCAANPPGVEDFSATSLETLRQMVAAGRGITLVPKLAAFPAPELAYIPFCAPVPTRAIGLAFRKTSPRRKLLLRIGDVISQQLGELKSREKTAVIPI